MRQAGQVKLDTHRIHYSVVREYVARLHRHLPKARPGNMASFGAYDVDRSLVGVASVGRAAARLMPPGVLEVDRVATDGTPNACSALYGAAARWARAARPDDVQWLVTYTLASEPGTSLRAAGWVGDTRYRGRTRTTWKGPERERETRTGHVAGPKLRWWLPLNRNEHPIQWMPTMKYA